jgi:hypothetical protein
VTKLIASSAVEKTRAAAVITRRAPQRSSALPMNGRARAPARVPTR